MHQPLRIALLVAAVYSGSAFAQTKPIDISAQSLGGALTSLATQSGIQILFNTDEVKGTRSVALHGQIAPEEALRKLLEGSGFMFGNTGKGTYVVKRSASGLTVLPEVLVTADAERGYKANKTTIAGKTPQTLREIPNSVSVLTRQQMDDQELVTMVDAMQQITGVTVIANDNLSSQYISRGYGLGVMYDGVTSYNGMNPSHQFDLPLYERIEVLRGPAGVLRGVGEPGGVVNLVKKRPKDAFSLSWATSAGSWDTYRAEGDITGPLNADKTLRGRLIVADEERKFFYDHTQSTKWLGAGLLEYVLSPQTTFLLSFSSQSHEVKAPYGNAVPGYTTYQLPDYPRSTNAQPDWSKSSYQTDEVSVSAEHKFDSKWLAKASFNHREQNSQYKNIYTGRLNPATYLVNYSTMKGDYDYTRDGFDVYANGPFDLLGRTHNLLIGFNRESYHTKGRSGSGPTYSNVVFGDLSRLVEPNIPYTSGSESDTTQQGVYSQVRLSLADPLTTVFGFRTTTFKAKTRSISPSVQTNWKDGAKADNEITPYAGILYDLTKQITLYGSYADIFVPQTQLKADGGTLDPRTGRQFEVGSKGEFFDGKLGGSIAFFNIRDKNRAFADPASPVGVTYYLNAGEIESKGWELEVSGSPLRGLDVTTGYTHLNTRYLKDRTYEGLAYSIQTPKDQFKIWGNYRFSNESSLAGVSVGMGGWAHTGVESSRGIRQTPSTGFTAVTNARVAYQIDKTYSLSLMVNNLFDRTYWASIGTNTYNFYGEPRNFMLTLRANY